MKSSHLKTLGGTYFEMALLFNFAIELTLNGLRLVRLVSQFNRPIVTPFCGILIL